MARLTTNPLRSWSYPKGLTGDSRELYNLYTHSWLSGNQPSAAAHASHFLYNGTWIRHYGRFQSNIDERHIFGIIAHHVQEFERDSSYVWPRVVLFTEDNNEFEINDPITGKGVYEAWAEDELRWSNSLQDLLFLRNRWGNQWQTTLHNADILYDAFPEGTTTTPEWEAVIAEWEELYQELRAIFLICQANSKQFVDILHDHPDTIVAVDPTRPKTRITPIGDPLRNSARNFSVVLNMRGPAATLSLRAVTKHETEVEGVDVKYSVKPPTSPGGSPFVVTARLELPVTAEYGDFEATFDSTPTGRGYSAAELVVALSEPTPTAALAPTSLVGGAGDGLALLSWANPSDDTITAYEYRVSADSGATWSPDWTEIADSGAATVSFTVPSLTNDTAHLIQLRAMRFDIAGDAASVTVTPTAPSE